MKTKTIKSNILILWGLTLIFLGGLPISADAGEREYALYFDSGVYHDESKFNLKKELKHKYPELRHGVLKNKRLVKVEVKGSRVGLINHRPRLNLYVDDKHVQEQIFKLPWLHWRTLSGNSFKGRWQLIINGGPAYLSKIVVTIWGKNWSGRVTRSERRGGGNRWRDRNNNPRPRRNAGSGRTAPRRR